MSGMRQLFSLIAYPELSPFPPAAFCLHNSFVVDRFGLVVGNRKNSP